MYTRETYSSFPRTSISTRSKTNSVRKSSANKSKPTTRPAKGTTNLKSREWKFVAEAVLKMTRRLFCAVARSPLPRKRERHPGGGGNRRTKAFPSQRKLSEKYTFQMLQPGQMQIWTHRVIITLCFDLVPSANQFMASKPNITNTTNNSINDKRQTYASLQFSFYFCDKYLILSSWFIGYRFLYLVLRFYFSYFLLVTPQPNNS